VAIDWPGTTGWDDQNKAPIVTLEHGCRIDGLPNNDVHLVLPPSNQKSLSLRALFEPAESDSLIVSLHGALDRGRFTVPRFEWRRTLSRLKAAKLYLSDSTLELSPNLEIGWYLGTAKQDLIAEYAELVRSVAAARGYSKIVCVGSSAGGFAALALSRRIPNSAAVVFSPQTAIGGYFPRHRKALSAVAFKEYASFDRIESDFASRVNMRRLYQMSEDRNYVHFVQNTGDRFHFESHYAPFALALGVDPDKGGFAAGRKVRFFPERHQAGHAPPSRGRFLSHIRQAHSEYYGVDLILKPTDREREQELGPR
jgi:pimeloyl-ACP methyl ester carboxylesterase